MSQMVAMPNAIQAQTILRNKHTRVTIGVDAGELAALKRMQKLRDNKFEPGIKKQASITVVYTPQPNSIEFVDNKRVIVNMPQQRTIGLGFRFKDANDEDDFVMIGEPELETLANRNKVTWANHKVDGSTVATLLQDTIRAVTRSTMPGRQNETYNTYTLVP